MRIPQELVNAIISYIDHSDDLEPLLNLLRASSVFSPPICSNLRRLSVHLQAPATYAQLWAMAALSPDVLPAIHHLRITGQLSNSNTAQPEKNHLAAMLDACTGLRILHIGLFFKRWSNEFLEQEQRALYRAMERPGLVALRLERIAFGYNSAEEISRLVLPPSLKALALTRIRQIYFPLAEPIEGESSMAMLEELHSDETSLSFARLMLSSAHSFGKLRRLVLTSERYGAPDILATPNLCYLLLRSVSFQPPVYNLSQHAALRTLHIESPFERLGIDSFGHIADALRSLPQRNSLEQFILTIICTRGPEDDDLELWRGLDEALSSEERFVYLCEVCIVLRVKEWRLADDDQKTTLTGKRYDLTLEGLLPKTWARGILGGYQEPLVGDPLSSSVGNPLGGSVPPLALV